MSSQDGVEDHDESGRTDPEGEKAIAGEAGLHIQLEREQIIRHLGFFFFPSVVSLLTH